MKLKRMKKRRWGAVGPSPKVYGAYTAGQKAYTSGQKGYTEAIREPIRKAGDTIRAVYGEKVKDPESVRRWTEKYKDIEQYERNRGIKRVVMAVCTALPVWAAYTRKPAPLIMALAMLALAVLIGLDVGRLWSRILADRTRGLLAITCVAWSAAAKFPRNETLLVAGALLLFAVIYIKFFNLKALSAQVYKRSDIVKKALTKTQPEVIDDMWQSTAARLVRSYWWEIGAEADEEIYEAAKKGTWLIGYAMGGMIKADTVEKMERLEAENAQLQDDIATQEEQIDRILEFAEERESYFEELEEIKARLAQAEAAAEAGEAARDRARILEFDKCRLEAQVNDLTIDLQMLKKELENMSPATAGADPAGTDQADGPEIIMLETDEERTERLLREAAAMGYGVTKAQKHAGCTHWQAQAWYKAHKAEVAEGKARAAERGPALMAVSEA